MSHVSRGHWMLRSIAGVVLIAAGAIGAQGSGAEATPYYPQVEESSKCRDGHDNEGHNEHDDHNDNDDEDHGHDKSGHRNTGKNRGRDDRGRGGQGHGNGGGTGLQQVIKVRVLATTFLRVDKKGRVTAAATNTGCAPSENDEVFLFQPNGTIEASFGKIPDCDWSGDFTVAGRFQPQDCDRDHRGRGKNDSSHRGED
jgi:hypothetical protein